MKGKTDMKYPEFFDKIETIKMQDDLSNFLGTFEYGLLEFNYLDIVKAAGHSCPTVAGAYIMTLVALKELYKDKLPKRGEIFVSFKEDGVSGVSGVIANVITQITGATENNGFKGLNGKFERYGLIKFNDKNLSNVKFQRLDTGNYIELIYDPSCIKGDPLITTLMQKMMQGVASEDEKNAFGKLWQQRVENIFDNIDKVIKIV
jgi:formylmethanofuran dehydrogenase subunit E